MLAPGRTPHRRGRGWSTPTGRDRAAGQPAVPGDDESGPETEYAPRDHGPGLRGGRQLLRHRQRLRLEAWRGRHRADPRPLVRRGRRALADKVVLRPSCRPMGDWPGNENKLSARTSAGLCEGSPRRMQTDYIDLYQMHHVDWDTPWDDLAGHGSPCSRARSCTSAPRTSPAGTSSRPTRPPGRGNSLGLGQRAVALQPVRALGRAGGVAGLPRLRGR